MQKNQRKKLSIMRRKFHTFEKNVCQNLKIFIGKHERTVEIIFLIIFFVLQGILAFYSLDKYITLIVIIFLFFLALERIFVHIWLEYEREQLNKIREKSKEKYDELRFNAYHEINKLHKTNLKLKEKIKRLK